MYYCLIDFVHDNIKTALQQACWSGGGHRNVDKWLDRCLVPPRFPLIAPKQNKGESRKKGILRVAEWTLVEKTARTKTCEYRVTKFTTS
jgi:hypothetical protein